MPFCGSTLKSCAAFRRRSLAANLAGIDDVARLEREAVEHRHDLRVRVLALDLDIDAADPIAGAFLDVVDDVELAGLFEKAVVGLDLGEHVAVAAVLVAELLQIEVLLVLVEELAAEQFQLLGQAAVVDLLIAQEGDVADRRSAAPRRSRR